MISNEQEAIRAGKEFLIQLGIEVFEVERIRKIAGSIRSMYLPDKESHFWMITFNRSKDILPSCTGETELERALISAVAMENGQVTVSVECDGSAKVV